MDVLELPRPVINFLRTMTKEGCRYTLSWDIFGGPDTVTLTLTWKLIVDESESSVVNKTTLKSDEQQIYDDLYIRNINPTLSPRRSRRDGNTPVSAIFCSSRGKSLEGTKQIPCHHQQLSNFKRTSTVNRQKYESDPIYDNLYNAKSVTNTSPSLQLNTNPILSFVRTHHRQAKQQSVTPTFRKVIPVARNTPTKSKRTNHLSIHDDNKDDTLDPWVKRFECSLEDNNDKTIQPFEDKINETGITTGKVKFKTKPDYF
jgi:hypothetical protein